TGVSGHSAAYSGGQTYHSDAGRTGHRRLSQGAATYRGIRFPAVTKTAGSKSPVQLIGGYISQIMHLNRISKKARQNSPFFLGLGFLLAFWFFGYDGITFSDDVIYLRMGQQFWDGETVLSSYHFSSRWGAYLFS